MFDMTAKQEHHICLLQNESNICKENSAVAMEKLNFDLKAVSINPHVARKHGYLKKYR